MHNFVDDEGAGDCFDNDDDFDGDEDIEEQVDGSLDRPILYEIIENGDYHQFAMSSRKYRVILNFK